MPQGTGSTAGRPLSDRRGADHAGIQSAREVCHPYRRPGLSRWATWRAEKLAACYRTSFALAAENGCKSIAFPCISTGVYGYPKEETVQISVREAKAFLAASTSAPPCATADEEDAEMDMIFCCFSAHDAAVYERFHNTRRTEET